MDKLLEKLKRDYKQFQFKPGANYMWSSTEKCIYYRRPIIAASLLHEVGHGILGHLDYNWDIELLKIEVDAWEIAEKIAPEYGIRIDPDHPKRCIETYKNWLTKRSQCPECQLTGIGARPRHYWCPNCHLSWTVPENLSCAINPTPAATNQ